MWRKVDEAANRCPDWVKPHIASLVAEHERQLDEEWNNNMFKSITPDTVYGVPPPGTRIVMKSNTNDQVYSGVYEHSDNLGMTVKTDLLGVVTFGSTWSWDHEGQQ